VRARRWMQLVWSRAFGASYCRRGGADTQESSPSIGGRGLSLLPWPPRRPSSPPQQTKQLRRALPAARHAHISIPARNALPARAASLLTRPIIAAVIDISRGTFGVRNPHAAGEKGEQNRHEEAPSVAPAGPSMHLLARSRAPRGAACAASGAGRSGAFARCLRLPRRCTARLLQRGGGAQVEREHDAEHVLTLGPPPAPRRSGSDKP
jgi:hypothetical protein